MGSIAIQNGSTVKATSVYGAGIGYGWTGYRKNGNIFESAKKCLPEVDVTISGADGEGNSCSVEAYSLMGAGIGSGGIITSGGGSVPVGEPLEIGSAGIAGWGTGANQDGEAVEQSLQSLASAPASSSARSVGSLDQSQSSLPAGIVDGLLLIEGSLTVDDTANVHAESGVCAIAFEGEVSTGQTIVQNTLREASDGGDAVEIMLGGTDGSAAQIKLGDLRDGFRSIAQTVPSAPSEIKFYWGSGEASRAMVNWYDAAGTLYDDTFSVTPGSFNSFFAVPPFDLHGVLTVSGTQTTGQVLTADKAGLEPNGATYALQWYMNGAPIEDGDGDAITADEAGVYYAVATGTGEYAGTVVSNALAVNADGATKPATPVLSEVTATSITLEDPQVEGLQYSIGFGTRWQSALAFNDLDPAATYYVICKNSDGGISDPLVVTTSRNSVLETGRISYNYETEQIYYSLDIGVYTDKGCTDRILRGSVITDLLDKDGGTTAYACYVGDPETLYEIMLKRPDAPEVNVKAHTSTSITIATQAGVAYNYAPKGEAVPDTNAFVGDGGDHTITGLLPGSTYTILTRTPASSTAFHSYEGAVDVTTKRDSPAAPTVGGAYVVSSSDSAKFAYTVEASGLPEGTTYEYKMDDGTWQESALFDGIEPESQHAFYARAAETDDAEVGDSGRATVTFDLLQGAGTVSLDGWTYGDAAETPVLQSDTNGTDSDSVTLEYKLSSLDDSAYTTDVPVNAGSYTVRATFAETAVYSSATATGTFTIAPRPVTLTWSESTFVYDGTAKVPTVEVANLVEGDSLVISVEVKKGEASVAEPTEVGDYTAAATSINQGEGQSYLNYTLVDGANLTHAYAIVQSTTDLTARADKSAYTYGETIVVTGSVTPAGEVANTLALDEPQPGEVALYYGETQISDAAEVGEDGSFELSYDTTDRAVPVGEGIGLEVRYVGNDSMAGSQAKMTVTIAKAVLTPTSIAVTDAGRAYDGTTALPEAAAVGVGFTGALEGDAVGLVANDAAYVSADAGTETVGASSFSPTTDAEGVDWTQWYEAATPAEALAAEDADGISQAAPTVTLPADPQELPSGATAGDLGAPSFSGVGGEPLEGALTWYSDEGRTQPLSEGDALGSGQRTLWWRFVPADPNYSAAEGSVTVSVAAPPAPSRPSFPVEVVAVGGGSASASPSRPHEGDTVTVSPEPGEGLVAGSVEVVDASGAPVEVAGNGDGTWSFTQPDSVVTVTVTFVCDGGALCPSAGLPDVDQSQWYHGAVDWALESGTMSGYATGLFGPGDPLAREQAAAVLYNLLGEDADAPAAPHADVDAAQWYARAVAWAVSEGVMSGYDEATFGVGDPLTREQFAAVLANACGADVASADQSSLDAFPDGSDVSPWARRAVAWAVSGGLLEGEEPPGGGRALAPGRAVTRAEMAAMAMRAVRAGVLEIG